MMRPILRRQGDSFVLEDLAPDEKPPKEALLVAAFSSPEDALWLPSPTLLLNASLGEFETSFLLKLALAEKSRFEEAEIKSYTLKRLGPVIVLAEREEDLKAFERRYGGLLEIFPVLIKGFSLAFPVAEEWHLEKTSRGFCLKMRRRLPLDPELCTYCGACGPVCPKGAITPEPTIDLSVCDACGQCLSVCPTKALDLHRFEQIEYEAPFVLCLSGVKPNLEALGLFQEEELDKLLEELGTFEVEELIFHSPGLCQYIARFGLGCTRCLENCPHGAITLGEEGVILDHLHCKGCGQCVGVCPTGALRFGPFSEKTFFSYLGELNPPAQTLVIGTTEKMRELWWRHSQKHFPETFFLVHEAPRSLSLSSLLFLMEKGFSRVFFFTQEAPPSLPLAKEIGLKLGLGDPFLSLSLEEILSSLKERPPKDSSFKSFKSFEISFKGRRKTLVEILGVRVSDLSPNATEVLEAKDFGEISLDKALCSLCGACLNECRTGAFWAEEESLSLKHLPALCIQCGVCAKICPEGALNLCPGLRLAPDFFEPQTLIQDEPVLCGRCGKVFATKRSLERVRKRLLSQGRFQELEALLDLCEDCRVIKKLEEV